MQKYFFLQNSKSIFVQTFRIMIILQSQLCFFFLVQCLVVGLGSEEIARFSKTKNKSHLISKTWVKV